MSKCMYEYVCMSKPTHMWKLLVIPNPTLNVPSFTHICTTYTPGMKASCGVSAEVRTQLSRILGIKPAKLTASVNQRSSDSWSLHIKQRHLT